MTLKKTSLFNQFLLILILAFANILKFIDFRLRTLFIFTNIIVISFVLMVYIKPALDNQFTSKSQEVVLSKPVEPVKNVIINTLPPETIPVKKLIFNPETVVNARSFIIYDLSKNQEIFQKDKKLTLPPASLVKMLSIMHFSPKIAQEKTYPTVTECNFVEGQKVGFKKNEKISGKDLIYSTLVFSAGDSVCNLYKITDSNLEEFNKYAKSIGMENSNFTNFIGLDYPGNYTTSEDMLTMTKEFIKNTQFNQIVTLKSWKMENGKTVYNTNKMLFEDKYSVGIKTGTTLGAKENLIYRHKDLENDLDILIILLNSESRYQDIRNIMKSLRTQLNLKL